MTLPVSADPSAAIRDLSESYTALRAKFSSEAYPLVVAWVESLIQAQQAHMTSCGPGRLEAAQTRLKLLMSMHRALSDPGGAFTGHVLD